MFQRGKKTAGNDEDHEQNGREGNQDEEGKKVKIYGITHWGRVRSMPRIRIQVKNFLQMGIG
eukprot:6202101-Pleurochrysis_carterae.AAC.5